MAGRGQRGLHRRRPLSLPEGSTDANEEERRTVEGTSPLKITAGRFFVAVAANAAIKSRQRRSTDGRGSLPLSSLRRRLPPAERGPQKDDGVACHRIMYGGLDP